MDLDATGQAELIRRGEIKPTELVEHAIAAIEAVDPELNAVIHARFDRAVDEARHPDDGPFAGVPFLAKDALCAIAGEPHHQGLRAAKDAGYRAPADSELYRRFRRAGFVCLGRTNVPELCFSATVEGRAYGACHNPWDTTRSTGGSSGGSAAAVAARLVPVAHANDAGGSIRIPASECGLVGLKPTRGRSTFAPDFGEAWLGFDHEHVVTRSVRDCAAVLDAIAGPAIGDPYTAPPPRRPWREEVGADPGRLRIGVMVHHPNHPTDPEVARAVGDAARLLEGLGHHVFDASLAHLSASPYSGMFAVVCAREVDRWSELLGRPLDDLEPMTQMLADAGHAMTATGLMAAQEATSVWCRAVEAWWENEGDLLLTPTITCVPPPLGRLSPDGDLGEVATGLGRLTPFTMPFDVTGQPAVSLPLAWSADGLPIGVQLVAVKGGEDVLIRIAAQLEQAQPWAGRVPAVHG